MTEKIVLEKSWIMPEAWKKQALKIRSDWNEKHVEAAAKKFFDYYHSRKSTREDWMQWEMAWWKWCRNQRTADLHVKTERKEISRNCPVCNQPGCMSHNTRGGPYYCRDHFSLHA